MRKRARARDLGFPLDGETGRYNAITDVAGIEVGYVTLRRLARLRGQRQVYTGVTVILPRGRKRRPTPVWAGHFDLNGNGEMTGTHWIDDAGYFLGPVCLTNTHSVGIVHHTAVGWMIRQYGRYFRGHPAWAMPVVAETYDGLVNDVCGRHLTEAHTLQAFRNARSGFLAEGNVGGGAGNQTYEFKGGTGTSSRRVRIGGREFVVGVLVQSNFGQRAELNVLGVPIGRLLTGNAPLSDRGLGERGSIIVVIATDAPLNPLQLRRLAKRGALGIGRTGTSGGHYSGDLMLALSVANETYLPAIGERQPRAFGGEWLNEAHLDTIYAAAVSAVEESVLNALLAAESVPVIEPWGAVLEAIDPGQLLELLRRHGRIS